VDQKSQQHALAAIQGVGTIVVAILSLVQSISSRAQVAQMASDSGVKLAAIEPYLNQSQSAQIVAAHYGEPISLARAQVAQVIQEEINAGF
jgi:cytochrome bd-type quinol oxidase subunit 1